MVGEIKLRGCDEMAKYMFLHNKQRDSSTIRPKKSRRCARTTQPAATAAATGTDQGAYYPHNTHTPSRPLKNAHHVRADGRHEKAVMTAINPHAHTPTYVPMADTDYSQLAAGSAPPAELGAQCSFSVGAWTSSSR